MNEAKLKLWRMRIDGSNKLLETVVYGINFDGPLNSCVSAIYEELKNERA